jgi:hypothetical protein
VDLDFRIDCSIVEVGVVLDGLEVEDHLVVEDLISVVEEAYFVLRLGFLQLMDDLVEDLYFNHLDLQVLVSQVVFVLKVVRQDLLGLVFVLMVVHQDLQGLVSINLVHLVQVYSCSYSIAFLLQAWPLILNLQQCLLKY